MLAAAGHAVTVFTQDDGVKDFIITNETQHIRLVHFNSNRDGFHTINRAAEGFNKHFFQKHFDNGKIPQRPYCNPVKMRLKNVFFLPFTEGKRDY